MKLKTLRVIIALISFSLFLLLFFAEEAIQSSISGGLLYLQFTPSLVKFLSPVVKVSFGFLIVIFLTLSFGRIYCSALCPLGISIDLLHRLPSFKILKRSKHKFKTAWKKTRLFFFFAVLISMVAGSLSLLNLLDPYSLFGRMMTNLLRPIQVLIHNLLVTWLENKEIYIFSSLEPFYVSLKIVSITLLFALLIIWFAYKYGRLYCNSICPVGTLLGFFSRNALLGFHIDKDSCTRCRRCEKKCKADCIDSRQHLVDLSRCVSCFNCIDACSESAIAYKSIVPLFSASSESPQRRQLLVKAVSFMGMIAFMRLPYNSTILPQIALGNNQVITPPGSINQQHFVEACTACHLCVDVCPTRVLQPSMMQYGSKGILQPALDFQVGYCENECNLCGKVCPTGAIQPLILEIKKTVKIGQVLLKSDLCIVFDRKEQCGLCIEICPTKAITPLEIEGLLHPEVEQDLCTGCGACQFICPTEPKSLIVTAIDKHEFVDLSKIENQPVDEDVDDFLKDLDLDLDL
ncbi:MAG: 4Fe-4S binding protein [Deltaproteobacteria bacterium]|jgi:ferredoxin|nr:4Fe-4S binding protein [Deltaproteobacteria bacterium]